MEKELELTKIVAESGLQLSEAEIIKQSYLPYFVQLAEIKEQAEKINFENPTELDEKIARDLRLKTVKIRTGSEVVKDERKRVHSLKANIEQSAWNLIKTTCQLEEEQFFQVEKKREIAEKLRVENLRKERLEIITPYTTDASIYPLGQMSEDSFNDLLEGFKLQAKAKEEAELKSKLEAEEEKKKEAEEKEKMRIENEKLKAENEAKEKAIAEEKAKAEKARIEYEIIAQKEREESDRLLDSQIRKAAEEKHKQNLIIKKQNEENAKLEAELKSKAEAEEKAKRDAEIKATTELKEKQQAEAKAKKAPDKEKLKEWVDSFVFPHCLPLESIEANEIAKLVIEKRNAFTKWALNQIASL